MPASRDLRLLVGAVGLSSLGDRVALVPLALLANCWSPRRPLIVSSLVPLLAACFGLVWMRVRVALLFLLLLLASRRTSTAAR